MKDHILLYDCIRFLDDFLESNQFIDFCPNGLQVEGSHEIYKVVSGVTASLELFEQAHQRNAQMVLVHHGILWGKQISCIVGSLKRRIEYLIQNKLSLVAYHLPLDAHLQVGNNIQIALQLGLDYFDSFAYYAKRPIGVIAKSRTQPIFFEQLKQRVCECYDNVFLLDFGPSKVNKVAIVSGAGAPYLEEAVQQGCNVLISGEVKESTVYLAREAGIHVIGLGHYASEKLGIKVLADHLSKTFHLQHEFIDIPNPL